MLLKLTAAAETRIGTTKLVEAVKISFNADLSLVSARVTNDELASPATVTKAEIEQFQFQSAEASKAIVAMLNNA